MKKIIIVNNNMKIGGVQKSLYNLLWSIDRKYDVTLCLFRRAGMYAHKLPPYVKIVEAKGAYRYLGMSQGECRGFDRVKRGILAALSRVIGRKKVLGLIKNNQPELDRKYDCAISFLHNGRAKAFYGGVQDFVLNCINADKKIAFLHCDYQNCGANNPDNNKMMESFDMIAACSDGCRNVFVSVMPNLANKCVTVRNCHRFDEIRKMADSDPIIYNEEFVNILVVARLSHEKGIDRAIRALSETVHKGIKAKLHIVGDGAMMDELVELTQMLGISEMVVFYGESENPYRYLKNADLLLVCSYHEAAPMVIEEARYLTVPILTTNTTSSYEMVIQKECGWVCDNDQDSLNDALRKVVSDKTELLKVRERLKSEKMNNDAALRQFELALVD